MEMAHNKMRGVVAMAVAVVVLAVAIGGGGGGGVRAQVLHVVGGDRGWEPSNFIGDWSSSRVFRVGDTIWFAYSTGQDSIVELGSLEEYESCDLSNPIRMYTDGLDKISLDGEGIRYFASGNIEDCKKGLKLPVNVEPQVYGPTPSAAPAESLLGNWPNDAESPITDGPFLKTKQAQSPSVGQEYGPISSLSSAESPLSFGSEGPTTSFPSTFMQFWENLLTENPLMDGADGPTSSSAMNSLNGLPIIGQKKWARRLLEKASDGPTFQSI